MKGEETYLKGKKRRVGWEEQPFIDQSEVWHGGSTCFLGRGGSIRGEPDEKGGRVLVNRLLTL